MRRCSAAARAACLLTCVAQVHRALAPAARRWLVTKSGHSTQAAVAGPLKLGGWRGTTYPVAGVFKQARSGLHAYLLVLDTLYMKLFGFKMNDGIPDGNDLSN